MAAAYPLMLRARRRRWRPRVDLRLYARAIAFAVIGAMLIAGVIVARRPAPRDARALLGDTLTTLRAGNYSAARRNGERAVAAAPRSIPAHLALARAQLALGDGLAAEAELDRAVQAGAPTGRLHGLTAEARLLQGDAAGALAEAAKASGDARADRVRALALAAQGEGYQARAVLADRATRDPADAHAWTALARLRLGAGDLGAAAAAAAQAIRRAPGDPAALTLQGEIVRARYGPVASLPWFAATLKRDTFYHPALIEQAATLIEVGRDTDALAATRKALLARLGDGPALYLQAVIAARAGRTELAEKLLAATGGALNGTPGVLLLRGALDWRAGRVEQAVAGWRRLVAAQPMSVTARRLAGMALLRSGDPRGALDMLRPIALRADADAYSLRLVARAWERVGARDLAARFLDRAAGARGSSDLFATDEALSALTAGAAAAAGDPTYALGVIRGLAARGDRTGALAKARALAAAAPGAPDAQLALGDMLATGGDWRGAAAVYARAADLRFDEPTALRLVDALGRAGRGRDAAAVLALYLGQNPQSLTGQRLRGHWLVASGDWTAAIETLESVRRQAGARDAALLADLAIAYAGAGEGAVARRYGAAAYRLLPMSAAACEAYGAGLAADGDLTGARQLLDKAVAIAPGDRVIAEHRRRLG